MLFLSNHRGDGLPGPGTYNNKLDGGIGYSIGRSKRGDDRGNNAPGPGSYIPDYEVNRNTLCFLLPYGLEAKNDGYKFGKSQRAGLDDRSGSGVGPGAYDYVPKDKSKLGRFGKQKRLGVPLTSEISLGPGQYNIESKNKGGWTIAKKYRTHDDLNIPGPGAY